MTDKEIGVTVAEDMCDVKDQWCYPTDRHDTTKHGHKTTRESTKLNYKILFGLYVIIVVRHYQDIKLSFTWL